MAGADLVLLTSALLLLRTYAFLATFPLFRQFLGHLALIAFAVALTCFGICSVSAPPGPVLGASVPTFRDLYLLAAVEALFGVLLAAPSALLLELLPQAGRLTDYLRGAMFAEQLLPGIEQRVSPLETLSWLALLFICFPLRGYTIVLAPLIESFENLELRPGLGLATVCSSASPGALPFSLVAAFRALRAAVVFASPAIIALLLFDGCVCIASRVVPRVSLSQELGPLKIVLGVLLYAWLFDGGVGPRAIFRALPKTVSEAYCDGGHT